MKAKKLGRQKPAKGTPGHISNIPNKIINMATASAEKMGKKLTKNKDLNQLSAMLIKMANAGNKYKVTFDLLNNLPSELEEVANEIKAKEGFVTADKIKDKYFSFNKFKELWIETLELTEDMFFEMCKKAISKVINK